MLCEIPIIASNVGGIKNIIKENKNGYLIESNNYLLAGKYIIELMNNKEKANKFIEENNKIRKKYNIKILVDKHLQLFNRNEKE